MERRSGADKPKKLALSACIRKLITILNMMLRNGERRDPTIATS